MWVSRKRFEDLADRVKALETGGVKTEDMQRGEFVFPGYRAPDRPYEISASKAVRLIADHLGLKFRREAERAATYRVEKVEGVTT